MPSLDASVKPVLKASSQPPKHALWTIVVRMHRYLHYCRRLNQCLREFSWGPRSTRESTVQCTDIFCVQCRFNRCYYVDRALNEPMHWPVMFYWRYMFNRCNVFFLGLCKWLGVNFFFDFFFFQVFPLIFFGCPEQSLSKCACFQGQATNPRTPLNSTVND